MCIHEWEYLQRPEEDTGLFGTRVSHGCEPPEFRAEN